MNRKNVEVGILRLYYIIWACYVALWAGIGGEYALHHFTEIEPKDWAAFVGFALVLPSALMLAVRWVYRGFVPKTAEA